MPFLVDFLESDWVAALSVVVNLERVIKVLTQLAEEVALEPGEFWRLVHLSCHDGGNCIAMHVGQASLNAVVIEAEFLVIEAEQA